MKARRSVLGSGLVALLVSPLLLASCQNGLSGLSTDPGGEVPLSACAVPVACDAAATVAPDGPALLVTDPAALKGFQLDRVLQKVLTDGGDKATTPREMLARLFDTMNTRSGAFFDPSIDTDWSLQFHCDDANNPAFLNHPAENCPRAEGKLAGSQGFFSEGSSDHFYPVAVVNRIDLMPVGGQTCGEYRVVFAKESGKTDPNDRVFLIFEGSLPNPEPGCLMACHPVASFWKGLEAEKDPAMLGEKLQKFFFEGLPGFSPIITPSAFGLGSFGSSGYYGTGGQVRLSQHIDADWEMRELVLGVDQDNRLLFVPKAVGNNPHPDFFAGKDMVSLLAPEHVRTLAGERVEDIGMITDTSTQSGESLQTGPHACNYEVAAKDNAGLHSAVTDEISYQGLGIDCPADDPLDATAILRRATMQSCAGCHAPSAMLGPERKIGCNLVWPDSLGNVHIDESGKVSPALKDSFLPHRAEVLSTYLQACDEAAIRDNIGGPTARGASKDRELEAHRTLGGSSTH